MYIQMYVYTYISYVCYLIGVKLKGHSQSLGSQLNELPSACLWLLDNLARITFS